MLPVAQFGRAPDCGSGGREFEPRRVTQVITRYIAPLAAANGICASKVPRWNSGL